ASHADRRAAAGHDHRGARRATARVATPRVADAGRAPGRATTGHARAPRAPPAAGRFWAGVVVATGHRARRVGLLGELGTPARRRLGRTAADAPARRTGRVSGAARGFRPADATPRHGRA